MTQRGLLAGAFSSRIDVRSESPARTCEPAAVLHDLDASSRSTALETKSQRFVVEALPRPRGWGSFGKRGTPIAYPDLDDRNKGRDS